jgi:hypothetical protein
VSGDPSEGSYGSDRQAGPQGVGGRVTARPYGETAHASSSRRVQQWREVNRVSMRGPVEAPG